MERIFFPPAREGRLISRNNLVIFDEVRAIERAILVQQDAGQLEAQINNTLMTHCDSLASPSTTYYKVWKGIEEDRVLEDQMNVVIRYFTDLGYSINRITANSGVSFNWIIKW